MRRVKCVMTHVIWGRYVFTAGIFTGDCLIKWNDSLTDSEDEDSEIVDVGVEFGRKFCSLWLHHRSYQLLHRNFLRRWMSSAGENSLGLLVSCGLPQSARRCGFWGSALGRPCMWGRPYLCARRCVFSSWKFGWMWNYIHAQGTRRVFHPCECACDQRDCAIFWKASYNCHLLRCTQTRWPVCLFPR